MPYNADRKFTDKSHAEALKYYDRIGWIENNPDNIEELDLHKGIDYVFDNLGKKETVQERFRRSKYSDYNEITLRYERPQNSHSDRKKSEYYKIEADNITYGFMNDKGEFTKFGIFNLNVIKQRIDRGDIIISTSVNYDGKPIQQKCVVDKPNLLAGFQTNKDNSSNFICINPKKYLELWPEDREEFVVYSFGEFV